MADTKVSALTANTAPLGGDYLMQVDDPGGTPTSKRMVIGDVSISNAPVQGGLINGYISATVASNNLTVAIKTMAGGDPSALDPVYCRIGNTVRKLTAALSVTKNAGTNWMNLGGAEHATQDVDLFAYLGYNATDGVVIGFSRLPYGRVYSDFNTTSTNERYAAISTITTAASTDVYENIGRFNATLSAGAGYTWSIPATSIVFSRPIFQTRWLVWAAQETGFSSTSTLVARYKLDNNTCHVSMQVIGTSDATNFLMTAPFTSKTVTGMVWGAALRVTEDAGALAATGDAYLDSASASITFRESAGGAWTNSGEKAGSVGFWYEL